MWCGPSMRGAMFLAAHPNCLLLATRAVIGKVHGWHYPIGGSIVFNPIFILHFIFSGKRAATWTRCVSVTPLCVCSKTPTQRLALAHPPAQQCQVHAAVGGPHSFPPWACSGHFPDDFQPASWYVLSSCFRPPTPLPSPSPPPFLFSLPLRDVMMLGPRIKPRARRPWTVFGVK